MIETPDGTQVSVRTADGEVVLCFEDDSTGFDPRRAHGRIVDLAERAQAWDGTFEVGCGPVGTDTILALRAPPSG
ncbi:hypothetical protein [Actinoplanes xinjiangensis]|uniref:hypothetical protein n=1 Tax=Actinoplanes xinjiangensis TaxID=512350 RepID=UPI00341B8D14